MMVDCEEDTLTSKEGRKLLCHALQVRNEEDVVGKEIYVKVMQIQTMRGSKVKHKGKTG